MACLDQKQTGEHWPSYLTGKQTERYTINLFLHFQFSQIFHYFQSRFSCFVMGLPVYTFLKITWIVHLTVSMLIVDNELKNCMIDN